MMIRERAEMLASIALTFLACNFTAAQQPADLNTLKSSYENARIQIGQDFAKRRNAGLAWYGRSLDSLLDAYKKKGDLDTYLLVQKEKERLSAEKEVPARTDSNPLLCEAMQTYHKGIEAANAERTSQTILLLKKYIAALDEIVKRNMLSDRIEEAKKAKTRRDLAASELDTLEASVAPPAAASPEGSSHAAVTPAAPEMSAWQKKKLIPREAKEFRGHHYLLVDTRKKERVRRIGEPKPEPKSLTWTEAQAECEKAGGHLAIANDADTFRFITDLAKVSDGNKVWIGLRRQPQDGSFTWVDGSEVQYNGAVKYSYFYSIDMRFMFLGSYYSSVGWMRSYESNASVTGYVCEWDY